MEGIHTLKDLVNPEDWLAKVDLKDAYFAIPIHQSHHQYLRFRFQGKCYQFKCLPFVPVISSLGYQDPEASTGSPSGDRGTTDSVHRRHPHSGGVQRVSEESCRGSSLPPAMPGFQKKSVLEPAQVMEFLGLTVDTVQMELRLPLEKIEDSCGVTGNDEGRACLRQRPSSSGGEDECNISGDSTSPTIFPPSTDGTVKYIKQPFPVLRGSGLPHPGMQGGIDVVGHPHDKLEWEVPPQEGSGHDNRLRCIPDRMGCNMSEPADRRSMVTDREQQAHKLPGAAGCDISSPDIPERQNQDVSTPPGGQHHSSGIHQQPGRNSLDLAKNQWMWCLERNIHITAQHLPGVQNTIADAESQAMIDRSDWQLNPVLFNRIVNLFGPIEVDMFASRLTTQCPVYYSWRPDPYAAATDAFVQNWSQIRGYANPPWNMIGRVLSQVQTQQAQMVLVAPVWKTQPW